MSKIEQGRNINQQQIQPKTEGVAKTAKSAEKSGFNLLSKFRGFHQRATLLGFLTLAGIMGSCGDNPLTDSSIVETQDNVKKTPSLKPNFGPKTLGEVKKIGSAENTPSNCEREFENYNVKEFLLNEMLTGYQCQPQKEQERIRNNLYIHSRGEPAVLLIDTAVPFVEVLKKKVEEENPPGMTEQEKTDKLVEMIVGTNRMGRPQTPWNSEESDKGKFLFVIAKRLTSERISWKATVYIPNEHEVIEYDDLVKEGFFFNFIWNKDEDWAFARGNRIEPLDLHQIDVRNIYVFGTDKCEWQSGDGSFSKTILSPGHVVKRTRTSGGGWSFALEYDKVLQYDKIVYPEDVIKPGSNSPHFAWSHQLQDVVMTDNQLILTRAFIYKASNNITDYNNPLYSPFIVMQPLDPPIPVE